MVTMLMVMVVNSIRCDFGDDDDDDDNGGGGGGWRWC